MVQAVLSFGLKLAFFFRVCEQIFLRPLFTYLLGIWHPLVYRYSYARVGDSSSVAAFGSVWNKCCCSLNFKLYLSFARNI